MNFPKFEKLHILNSKTYDITYYDMMYNFTEYRTIKES